MRNVNYLIFLNLCSLRVLESAVNKRLPRVEEKESTNELSIRLKAIGVNKGSDGIRNFLKREVLN